MNTNKLKAYAQTARREFIDAVTERAHHYGLKENSIVPCEVKGDFAIINGSAFPKQVDDQRRKLEEQVTGKGFIQVMEEVAYTWFNRFAAIRYMELHGFLSHGYRVLSHPEGNSIPEILEKAQHVELTGLDKEEVIKLKMDGTKDEKLYSKLLIAECNELSKAMPFLFERVQDYTELLLPDNLLNTDSVIRQMVDAIPEEDWQEIEIIGWIYQFYISEKQDQVIGKVVASVDIPAATQLFTPNWIVKYMVQNSLGSQWLETYPHSPLKGQMEYYIEPAEQSDEVKAQLMASTPSTLNPEELILIDPASGSGHILVEAYELFKAIYLERGYRQRDVAQLIIEKNLFGLDIDERAVQLTGFALIMKARADDRRLFERGVKLNVIALVDSVGFDSVGLAKGVDLAEYGLQPSDLTELKQLFEHATTFGSLIQVPEGLKMKLPALKQLSETTKQDLFVSDSLNRLKPLVRQAELLAMNYDVVIANPPYIGGKFHTPIVKNFLKGYYKGYEKDLFAAFIERNLNFCVQNGRLGYMTPQVWMFISSYEKLRARVIDQTVITTLVHPEYNAFWDSAHVAICSFTIQKRHVAEYIGTFIRLADFYGAELQPRKALEAINNPDCGWLYRAKSDAFKKVPGSPIAFWLPPNIIRLFDLKKFGDILIPKFGMSVGDGDRFIRRWAEVSFQTIGRGHDSEDDFATHNGIWAPLDKGGLYRKWYGNIEFVVYWRDKGQAIRSSERAAVRSPQYFFWPRISWSLITSAHFSARIFPPGMILDTASNCLYETNECIDSAHLATMNSAPVEVILKALNPTVNTSCGVIANVPALSASDDQKRLAGAAVYHATIDWNAYERSWDFQSLPILTASSDSTPTLESSYTTWITQNRDTIAKMKHLEEENNRIFIDAYGLADELIPDVPIEQITLTVNPAYRYGGNLTMEEQWTRFRQDTMEELVSYVVGCMMGRYSLDKKGLVYAHASNECFDHNNYKTFPADDDGIIPITEAEWFDDDAACRFFKFIETVWDKDTLEENLEFVADAIGRKANESSRDSVRRYFVNDFFKDHLKTYKKRPIYWLFTSGKEKAFQALVYLHRYNEGTLSRMRTEYVLPLQGKMATRMEHLWKDKDHATSTSAVNKIQKEIGNLIKQKDELLKFDENLHHFADKKISLDLDDGVKVNYGRFGNLLAEVKAVTGKK